MKPMKDMAREALFTQSACNLSGLIHSFSRTMTDLRAHMEQEPIFSTDKLNRHPICVLYSTQIAYLTGTSGSGCENAELYRKANQWALDQSSSDELVPWNYNNG